MKIIMQWRMFINYLLYICNRKLYTWIIDADRQLTLFRIGKGLFMQVENRERGREKKLEKEIC